MSNDANLIFQQQYFTLIYIFQPIIFLNKKILEFQFFAKIINCHNTNKKKAVPFDVLYKLIKDSSGKSINEAKELLNLFIEICPQYLEKKVIRKVEQVLRNYNQIAPEFDRMEAIIKETLEKEKKK